MSLIPASFRLFPNRLAVNRRKRWRRRPERRIGTLSDNSGGKRIVLQGAGPAGTIDLQTTAGGASRTTVLFICLQYRAGPALSVPEPISYTAIFDSCSGGGWLIVHDVSAATQRNRQSEPTEFVVLFLKQQICQSRKALIVFEESRPRFMAAICYTDHKIVVLLWWSFQKKIILLGKISYGYYTHIFLLLETEKYARLIFGVIITHIFLLWFYV